jgi:hypothetical protein
VSPLWPGSLVGKFAPQYCPPADLLLPFKEFLVGNTAKPRPKQSLAILMRELRKLLPPNVKRVKDSDLQYIVDDRILLTLNYFCNYTISEDKKREPVPHGQALKTCHPHSVSVAVIGDYIKKQLNTDWYIKGTAASRTRTIPRRQDGSISVESIAAAVVKVSNEIDKYITRRKEEIARAAAERKLRAAKQQEIADLLAAYGNFDHSNYNKNRFRLTAKDENAQIEVSIGATKDNEPTFQFEVGSLTKSQLEQLVAEVTKWEQFAEQ